MTRYPVPGRRALRRPARRVAWARVDESSDPIRCVVLDYSEEGARLSFEDSETLLRFTLLSTPGIPNGRACRVRWRRGPEIGVEFV